MDAELVVTKTPKGEQAIEQRSQLLDRNLRYVLILVDGSSSIGQLREKGAGLPDFDESLRLLADQGFIAVGQAGAEGESGSGAADFAGIKQQLIAVAEELLQADAEKVVKKLRAAPESREGMLEVISSCKKMVKLIIDEKKAEQLMSRCSEILEAV